MGRPAVFSGALRDPNESGSLNVTLSMWDDQVVLHNDNVELGDWPRDVVRIFPLDSTAFEFVAEGDRMLFVPDDRNAFTAALKPPPPPDTSRRLSRSKQISAKATPKASRTRRKGAKAASRPKTKKVKRAAPSSSRQKTKPVVEPEMDRVSVSTTASSKTLVPEHPSKPSRVAKVRLPGRRPRSVGATDAPGEDHKPAKSRSSKIASARPTSTKTKAPKRSRVKSRSSQWVRTIDLVRTYSVFGLDRVPVDMALRGSEHQHTWDHRAAAASGPSKHICTICGRIRIRRG